MITAVTLPAMYSTISPEAAARFIEETFDTGPVTSCRLLKRGWNDTYEAQTRKARYALRIYRAQRTLDEVLYELELIEHVREHGVGAAALIRTNDGSPAVTVQAAEGERCAVLFEYVEGEAPEVGDLDAMYRLGLTAATLHEAADSFSTNHHRAPLDIPQLLDEPIEAVRPHLLHRPADENYLLDFANRLRRRLEDADTGFADIGPCHGDLHTANVRCRSGELVLFDFDFCGRCFRAYDLATFAGVAHMKKMRPSWASFLGGYNDRRPLNEIDLRLIPVFTAVRFIWLVGTRVARSPESGEAWIESYLDVWFETLRRSAKAMKSVPQDRADLDDVINMVDGRRTSRRIFTRLFGK